jgi:predicted MFS family arabinose efflux permease
VGSQSMTQTAPLSPLAPFRHPTFLWLWVGVVTVSVGIWALTVGAQWLFVDDPNGAPIVALVQTAMTLPMMVLALPAGVLADALDGRWLLLGMQVYLVFVAGLLALLTGAGLMPPALLLAFTCAVGAAQAVIAPTWQAMIAEVVPRHELAAATRLDMVSVNVSRAAGPAIAGVVIAQFGVPWVFLLTAATAVVLAVVLLAWRRPRAHSGERDPFLPALVAGGRYVRNEPVVRLILVRFATFVAPACAVWALLPLLASRQFGLDADGYGLLFAGLGSGAVAAALILGWVKQRLTSNAVVGMAAVSFGAAFAALVLVSSVWVALPLLFVCGFAWTATVSTVISELQLFLPSWVRARGIAVYLMVLLGCQALASPGWGLLTQQAGLRTTVLVAALLATASAAGGWVWPVPDHQDLDRTPAVYWGPATIRLEPEPRTGPVVVFVEYDVAHDEEATFLAAMAQLRLSRLRSGASRWELYRVGETPEVFVEEFQVPTWREHLRQHEGRLTLADQAIEAAVFRHVIGTPRHRHHLPPDVARSSLTAQPAIPPEPGRPGR